MTEQQIQELQDNYRRQFPLGKQFTVLLEIKDENAIWDLMSFMYGEGKTLAGCILQRIDLNDMTKNSQEDELFEELARIKGYEKSKSLGK